MRIKLRKREDSPIAPPEAKYSKSREYLDSIWGNITTHGIKIMSDGNQWVINCLTGEVMGRSDAQAFRDPKGNIMWIGKNEQLSPLDRPTFYQWKNPSQLSI
jgi:hypothetical protein